MEAANNLIIIICVWVSAGLYERGRLAPSTDTHTLINMRIFAGADYFRYGRSDVYVFVRMM